MTVMEHLRSKANSLPESPGVYIMKDIDGKIIYVGKSKKLKNRVTSYFSTNHNSIKTARMVSLVRDFDYILCKTEIEALTLENVLIKKHSPKYNIKLKDAKSYPYIKITAEEYPKLIVTRDRRSDKAKYFGPYQGASAAYSALDTVMKIFALPTCKRSFPKDIKKERPCIYKDMGRCIAPCTGEISPEEYRAAVKGAEWVLAGNVKETVQHLTEKMQDAAENMEFERAAAYRDSITALKATTEKQKVVADEKINRDVFAIYNSDTEGVLSLLSVRGGALVGKCEFILSAAEPTNPEDAVYLIADHYENVGSIPREVMLAFSVSDEDISLLSEYLSILAERRVVVKIPERGDAKALCKLALDNAKEAARQYRLEGEREDKSVKRLSTLLAIPDAPTRIEAYDISNIGDENIVASMVVWERGKLKKSDYRSFKITSTDGRNDYGSMREALSRRLSHIGDGTPSLGQMPDLLLLDGGATHVGAIKPILREMELDIPVFGMVKDDYHKTRAITDGEREISIAQEMNVYAFVYTLQEEAHRFAYKSSQKGKEKSLTHSSLEKIEGIGPKKAKTLLSQMSLSEIRAADKATLSALKGISEKDAEKIYEYYKKKKKGH